MRNSKRILSISVSAGAGHVRAAQALCAAGEKYFEGVETIHLDLLDLVPSLFKKSYGEGYLKLVERHPALWGYFYEKTNHTRSDSKLRRLQYAVERLNTKKLEKLIEQLKPDAIIATHFMPAQLLSRLLGREELNLPVWVAVTDFDVHSLWIQKHMRGYFAANGEVAFRMAAMGIDPSAVRVTGIPLMPVFSETLSKDECRKELGLSPGKTTFLMMSGGAGIGGIDGLAKRVLDVEGDFQVVAIAGRNEVLHSGLRELAKRYPGKLFPMGFTTTIERVMAASDIAITKPGGLTSSECLAMGLGMIVVSPIPGQEERNAEYLMENGAALKAHDVAGLEYRVRLLLGDRERITALRRNALALGRPEAARSALEAVL
ncbi:galactosyldiacylglycerol synthase [bacterium]|nr:MAG: galactosyldiacylglycerol synthase [bacterium]